MEFPAPTILMCPPDFYGIEYEINPWMSRSRASDERRARDQWQALFELLSRLGTEIRLMPAVRGLPDLVFTANAALIWRDVAYLARFRHAARQGETPRDEAWFRENNFDARVLPAGLDFEGAGDALFCGQALFGGYMIRSDARALQWLAAQIGCPALPLQLVDDRYYHLDTCFCPLTSEAAIYYPAAFDDYGRRVLIEHVPTRIAVSPEEAARFACNAVVVGQDVVLNTGCPRLEDDL